MNSSGGLKISKDPNLHRDDGVESKDSDREKLHATKAGGDPQASPEEGGSDAEHHGAPLVDRVPVVVHVTDDPGVRGDD